MRVEYLNVSSGAGAASAQIDPVDIYKYQLERDPFAPSNVGYAYTLVATGIGNGDKGCGAMSWEEVVS